VRGGALRGIAQVLHFAGDSHGAGDDPFVAFAGEPELGAEAFGAVERALLGRPAVGDPAFVAIDDAGDGGLVEIELVSDPGLLVAFKFDPAVDEAVAVGGGPGAGGVASGCHGWCSG